MFLRTFLITVLQLPALILFAQTDAYTARRDSVLHAPKMQAVLQRDSALCKAEYFMRKNQVRVMVRTKDDEVDSLFYTTWGGLERSVSYMHGAIWSDHRYEYNEFGDVSKLVYCFYYHGSMESRTTALYTYTVQPDGLTELLMRTEEISERFKEDELTTMDTTVTVYEYDALNRLTMTSKTGKHIWCDEGAQDYTETVTYAYDKRGDNHKQVAQKNGSCRAGQQVTEMSYNASHQLIRKTVFENGDTLQYTEWIIGTNGRDNEFRTKWASDKTEYYTETYYMRNGLESQWNSTYNGEQSVTHFSYIYYAANGMPEKKKRKK